MVNKFRNIIYGIIIVILVVGIAWWVLSVKTEIGFYCRIFLLMFAVNTFAILRLYNSIVQNTRFSIKLRESMLKFQQTVPLLERALRGLITTINVFKTSMDSLRKETSESIDILTKINDKINKLKC